MACGASVRTTGTLGPSCWGELPPNLGWAAKSQDFGDQQKALLGYGWAENLEPKTEEGQWFWAVEPQDLEAVEAQEAQN